ncbi:DNA replication/repair protein RecF [Thalassotalea euphylliae]|uniref:DNA replication/repair protein RecF n=1 Tax=Thalassotalea euphylliae TaxID=1655234 RepID=UPI00363CD8F1
MTIVSLYVKNLRNLNEQGLKLSSSTNIVIGDNGSGKSSILESLFCIGHGKSFRTIKSESICHFEHEEFFINVKDEQGRSYGLSKKKSDPSFQIKIDNARVSKLSELAKHFAVQIVTPESFKLFFGGAKERRKFLDLGLFHVEHLFSEQWKWFSKIHKQRNALIKTRDKSFDFEYWTNEFVNSSEQISKLRSDYVIKLENELASWLPILLPEISDRVSLHFYKGWSSSKPLHVVLKENFNREMKQGFSFSGAHKFDLKFLVDGKPLDLKLSRGQQKLFLVALTFAQTKLIEQVKPVKPILLIDDFGAELDVNSRVLLEKALSKLDCQMVITAIEKSAVESLFSSETIRKNCSMFHVEHGKISEMKEIG